MGTPIGGNVGLWALLVIVLDTGHVDTIVLTRCRGLNIRISVVPRWKRSSLSNIAAWANQGVIRAIKGLLCRANLGLGVIPLGIAVYIASSSVCLHLCLSRAQ